MLAGTLAITGVGVVGVFGFAGFYSKDAILEAAFASGSEMGRAAFWMGAFAALLTSFYSWRLMFLTFWGNPRWAESEHIQHAVHHADHDPEHDNPPSQENAGDDVVHHAPDPHHGDGTAGYHPHESPWSMLAPLAVLSIGAVFAGVAFHHAFIDAEGGQHFWNGSLFFDTHLMHAMHEVPIWVKLTPAIVMLIGLGLAWNNYIRRPDMPAKWVEATGPIHNFLMRKWYFDEIYHLLFVRPSLALGRLFWHRGDEKTIDRFGPHGAAFAVGVGNRMTARLQSGYLNSYALVMLLGLVGAATWAMTR
jgi:NADH-quinone oxidoreductase subunit L